MSITFWWIPNVLFAVGLGVCIVQGVRKHSLGLCLFAVYFAYNLAISVVEAVRQHQQDAAYLRSFVHQQIGPNTWTAPVLSQSYNLAAPFTSVLLVLVAILFARSLAARRAA
jgi:hypothetical protein